MSMVWILFSLDTLPVFPTLLCQEADCIYSGDDFSSKLYLIYMQYFTSKTNKQTKNCGFFPPAEIRLAVFFQLK